MRTWALFEEETGLVVRCPTDDYLLPWHVEDAPTDEGRKIAAKLAEALNELEQYRAKLYGY